MILFALILWTALFYFVLDRHSLLETWLLKVVISFLFITCATTFLFFLSLVAQLNFNLFQLIYSAIPLFILLYYLIFIRSKETENSLPLPYVSNRGLIIIFSSLIVFTILFFNSTQRWGHWDAWAIWTMHAKFLLFENDFWNVFTNDIDWVHPDYPLMLPSIIAIIWKSFQTQSAAVPLIIAYVTCFLILMTIIASFIEDKQLKKGILCLLLLSCTNMLSKHGGSQYADTLLSLFILIPFVLIKHLPKEGNNLLFFLIGFFVASSGWVKNEGLAFFALFSFFFFISSFKNKRAIIIYLMGCIIPLIVIGCFKIYIAPANDLVSGNGDSQTIYTKLFDINRHYITMKYFIVDLIIKLPILVFLVIYTAIKFQLWKTLAFRVIAFLLILYYFVYILTPRDLVWQLSCSFDRLAHQITAVMIYTIFIVLESNWLKEDKSSSLVYKIQ